MDTSKVQIGRAPMTNAKATQASEQCPVAAKWLKSVIMDRPNSAAHVPVDVEDYQERAAWDNDKHKMTFKSRGPSPPALTNLVGEALEITLIAETVLASAKSFLPSATLVKVRGPL